MDWSSSGNWLISADNNGIIKYFQSNMNNLQALQGHKEAIRDISFAPNDARFATGSDDGTIKIWNFEEMREEKTLSGMFTHLVARPCRAFCCSCLYL